MKDVRVPEQLMRAMAAEAEAARDARAKVMAHYNSDIRNHTIPFWYVIRF